MKISPEIKVALSSLIDGNYGTPTQLARAIGVAHTTVLAWLNGKADEISGDIWYERLEPLLRPYLADAQGSPAAAAGAPAIPASGLKFVQALKRRPPMRPIVEAIVAELDKMTDMELSMLLTELIQGNERKSASAAEREEAYKPLVKTWLLLLPKMGLSNDRPAILGRMRAAFNVLEEGPFKWEAVIWNSVPRDEALEFDRFLSDCFNERVPAVVESLLPKSGPYAMKVDGVDSDTLLKTLREALPPDVKFHAMPYREAAHSKCM